MTNNSRQVAVRIFTPGGAYTDHVSEALCTEETKRRGRDGFGDAGRAVYLLRGGSVMPGAGDIITDGDRTLWIDVGEFSHGVPEWDISILWTMAHNMKADRSVNLFHITPETFNKHWNIFLPAYLGTTDPGELETYTRRLFPYYAAKVPYVFDMAYHTSLPDMALQKTIQMLPNV